VPGLPSGHFFYVCLNAWPCILKTPVPAVWNGSLGLGAVYLLQCANTRTGDFWHVQTDLLQAVEPHVEAAGISFPFPRRKVRVISTPIGQLRVGQIHPHTYAHGLLWPIRHVRKQQRLL